MFTVSGLGWAQEATASVRATNARQTLPEKFSPARRVRARTAGLKYLSLVVIRGRVEGCADDNITRPQRAPEYPSSLKVELQCQLDQPRRLGRENVIEGWRTDIAVRQTEIRM